MQHAPYTDSADVVRKRHLYRRLILTRKVALPRASAVRLIGPDCAYHLYGDLEGSSEVPGASRESLSEVEGPGSDVS